MMACETVPMLGGGFAIVCGTRHRPRLPKCKQCGKPARLLCDWKIESAGFHKSTGTCDAPICERCTVSPAPDKDLCPAHAREFAAWRAQRAAQR